MPAQLPPFIASPPHTICLGVGRQLFIDDYLIDNERSNVHRVWHDATVRQLDVLRPDKSWEVGGGGRRTARPFGGASLLDPRDQTLRLYYRCGWRGERGRTCLALSRDGLHFTKPALSVRGKGSEVNGAEQRSSWRDIVQGAGENGLIADLKTGLEAFEDEVHKTQTAEDKTPEDQQDEYGWDASTQQP